MQHSTPSNQIELPDQVSTFYQPVPSVRGTIEPDHNHDDVEETVGLEPLLISDTHTNLPLINSTEWTEWTTVQATVSSPAPLSISKTNNSSWSDASRQPNQSWESTPATPTTSNQMATLATIANSVINSAAILPITRLNNSNKNSSTTISTMVPVLNISVEDDDYEWSNPDQYQLMINLSIAGIMLTTVVLVLFLLWLCCSKNDRDRYSIRKVTGNHHRQHHRNSINGNADCMADVVINSNQKRRSNCSLYISNPNSEDSQPDLQAGSIMFQNRITSDRKPVTVIRQYDAECGYTAPRHSYDAILKPDKCSDALTMVADSDWTIAPNSHSRGSQLARNLATYCQQQHNQRFTKLENVECDGPDLMRITGNPSLIDGSDYAINEHPMLNEPVFGPLERQANFTKKRRNRMHNDSAAAIAMNRSGLLLSAIDENLPNQLDSNRRVPPGAILTYYERMSRSDSSILDSDECDNLSDHSRRKKHQNSPESSSGDSIVLNNQRPIVVYNERTAL